MILETVIPKEQKSLGRLVSNFEDKKMGSQSGEDCRGRELVQVYLDRGAGRGSAAEETVAGNRRQRTGRGESTRQNLGRRVWGEECWEV